MSDLYLLATNVGLADATQAEPDSAVIKIATFAIGSGFGYDPERTDESLNGNLLYSGVPLAYKHLEDGTLQITLRLPPDVGPFDFGEVAVYLPSGIMFAKGVFPTLQTKFTSLGTNVFSSYTFNVLLKLEQSTAVFEVNTDTDFTQSIMEVEKWSDVYPSIISPSPDTPCILVKELTINNNSSFLHRSNDSKWTIGTSYTRVATSIVTNGSLIWIEVNKSSFEDQELDPTAFVTDVSRKYVIEFADGFFRSVASVTEFGNTLRFNLNPDPLLNLQPLNAPIILYIDDYFLNNDTGGGGGDSPVDSIVFTFDQPGTYQLAVPEMPEGWDTMQLGMSIQGGGAGGGGGAGSGAPNSNPCASGGGGGAGAFMTYDVTSSAEGTMITVVVGTGGAGGGATGGQGARAASGIAGGASAVTVPGVGTFNAVGGVGGTGAQNPWSSSYQSAPGGSIGGGSGSSGPGRGSSGESLTYYGGAGGPSRYGAGGATTGGNAVGIGAGGGGGRCVNVNSDYVQPYNGGAGRGGQVILEFYDPNVVVLNSRYIPLIDWLDSIGKGPVPANAR